MTRFFILAIIMLLAPALPAQGAAAAAGYIPYQSLELLPSTDYMEHQAMLSSVQRLYYRARRLDKHAKKLRANLRKLRKEQGETEQELVATQAKFFEVVKTIEERLRNAGLDDATLARARAMPRGPLRAERYGHACVLEAPDLAGHQKDLLQSLVVSTNAAQAALRSTGLAFQARLKGKEKASERGRIRQSFRTQHNDMEQRFWKVVAATLTEKQMRDVRKVLPLRHQSISDLRGHLYQLPGMTPSQGNRINAAYEELDSERAADDAEIRRLRGKLNTRGMKDAEVVALRRGIGEAQARVTELRNDFREAITQILNARQLSFIRATPPFISSQSRRRGLDGMFLEVTLSDAQIDALQAMQGVLQEGLVSLRKKLDHQTKALRGQVGSDSPQSMSMSMMQYAARGDAAVMRWDLARRAIRDVLDKEQIVQWVVAPERSGD